MASGCIPPTGDAGPLPDQVPDCPPRLVGRVAQETEAVFKIGAQSLSRRALQLVDEARSLSEIDRNLLNGEGKVCESEGSVRDRESESIRRRVLIVLHPCPLGLSGMEQPSRPCARIAGSR